MIYLLEVKKVIWVKRVEVDGIVNYYRLAQHDIQGAAMSIHPLGLVNLEPLEMPNNTIN